VWNELSLRDEILVLLLQEDVTWVVKLAVDHNTDSSALIVLILDAKNVDATI
jgi:hypothetical protein